tara:strand:- start:7342 stop:7767 length:426 start_codon:yes stop_codon:yes gene_type:complete
MKKLYLKRFAYSPMGTFGTLIVGGFECYTVERPWLNNKVGESCIPEYTYKLTPERYNRGGYDAYELQDVQDRTEIKIHIANSIDDVIGCIGLGENLGYVANKWAVTSSKKAFSEFIEEMNGEEGEISIFSVQQGVIYFGET